MERMNHMMIPQTRNLEPGTWPMMHGDVEMQSDFEKAHVRQAIATFVYP
jgi:hypothetical protein